MVSRPVCLLILALAGCSQPEPAPVIESPSVPVATEVVEPPASVQALAPEPLIPAEAIDLIVSFEVGSPELYERRYKSPIWPGAASGPTWGIGYDGGHRDAAIILTDWHAHPHAARMATASGVTGPISREWVRKAADISVEWGMARHVFDQTSLIEHYRIARRVFGPERFDRAPGLVRGALLSVVFNRGGSMSGEGRREMRAIRDVCLPSSDWSCVAAELRGMKRIWVGSDIEGGMNRRREAEAKLVEAT